MLYLTCDLLLNVLEPCRDFAVLLLNNITNLPAASQFFMMSLY